MAVAIGWIALASVNAWLVLLADDYQHATLSALLSVGCFIMAGAQLVADAIERRS